jgi:radical SAM protein with 4Fe4S-binding SPASM domain
MLVLSEPAIFSLELTALCNNRCAGCSNVYAQERPADVMRASIWRGLLTDALPAASQIRLTGGEPTLHPDFFNILDFATSFDAWVTVFTNARWPNPSEVIQGLVHRPKLAGLLISLHGVRPESHEAFTGVPGSFLETLHNITLATEAGIPVTLSTVITRHNWKELDAISELGEQIGVNHVSFARFIGRPHPDIEPTTDQLRMAITTIEALYTRQAPVRYGISIPQCFAQNHSEGCLAGAAFVAIDPWGNLRPCNHSPTVIGSLHTATLPEIWWGETMEAWRAHIPSVCPHCAAFSLCHGGCRAIQELRDDGRDPLQCTPLAHFDPVREERAVPANVRPTLKLRIRKEQFGYALLGAGQVVPVSEEALPILKACDGSRSFVELITSFGDSCLDLLGELWYLGMLNAN